MSKVNVNVNSRIEPSWFYTDEDTYERECRWATSSTGYAHTTSSTGYAHPNGTEVEATQLHLVGEMPKLVVNDIDLSETFVEKLKGLIARQEEINAAKPIPRPEDMIEKVYFNYDKRATTIIWKDGQKTTVTCHEEEKFDPEKGLAMCFMKKAYDNRGCFNEFLQKWCEEGEVIKSKAKKKKKSKRK